MFNNNADLGRRKHDIGTVTPMRTIFLDVPGVTL